MERNVLWIGYGIQLRPLATEIILGCRRDVNGFQFADEGLNAATNKQYPLVLVNDVVPAGDLVLPEQVHLEDTVRIGCHVIGKIRSEGKSKDSPIVVTHIGHFPGYTPGNALALYKAAGTTECINWSRISLSGFAGAVGKYL